jgi:hypothetical protein
VPAIILFIRIARRVLRALVATGTLFLDGQARRAFPWRYVRRLPRESFAVAVLLLTLTGSLLTALAAFVVPDQQAGTKLAGTSITIAAVGILSGGLRQLRLWWRIRR